MYADDEFNIASIEKSIAERFQTQFKRWQNIQEEINVKGKTNLLYSSAQSMNLVCMFPGVRFIKFAQTPIF